MPPAGSSPRVRGTPVFPAVFCRYLRFIPARAGNMRCLESSAERFPVHPRACGEHKPDLYDEPREAGSSPRVRGTRRRAMSGGSDPRFIPARAGNTRRRRWRNPWRGSSPRVRGDTLVMLRGRLPRTGSSPRVREHPPTPDSTPTSSGSSPRVRGTPMIGWPSDQYRRFIPARAGTPR